ncbi:MAG: site-2 protease family protein [Chloroflexi bacterium]|nr:site-2 protease family protein [Chloroflexota bacterium]
MQQDSPQLNIQQSEDQLLRSVRAVMRVEEVTHGSPGDDFVVRFRGKILGDSEAAYERLNPVFSKQGMTLLFREEDSEHFVQGIPELEKPKPSNPSINVLLFILTLFSVLTAGVLYSLEDIAIIEERGLILGILSQIPIGIPFAFSLLSILLAHEFGHYLAARYHKVPVSLPYFLPFPVSLFGTLGAFIKLKAPPRNRNAILDIGIAGPLAGMAVAIPILFLGLVLSEVKPLPPTAFAMQGTTLEGNSLLYLGAKFIVTGQLLPAPADYAGLNPVLYWIRYFFLGLPTPIGGTDILLHPIAWAGWAGLLVTALNLIPAGQLDGGHVMYVLLGQKVRRTWPFIVVLLIGLGVVWSGWYLWAAMIFFMGRTHVQPLNEITPLDNRRKWIAIFGLLVFILVFTPVPLRSFLN